MQEQECRQGCRSRGGTSRTGDATEACVPVLPASAGPTWDPALHSPLTEPSIIVKHPSSTLYCPLYCPAVVTKVSDQELYIVVNAGCREKDLAHLGQHLAAWKVRRLRRCCCRCLCCAGQR